jgi:hypothetical protein
VEASGKDGPAACIDPASDSLISEAMAHLVEMRSEGDWMN